MKEWRGVWFPDDETHLIDWMQSVNKIVNNKPTYQYHKYQAARDLCKQRRRVIDVGGNIGLWSMHMVNDFGAVEAFEPVKAYGDIFLANVKGANLHRVALGDKPGVVSMVKATDNSCGDTRPSVETDSSDRVVEDQVKMLELDSFQFINVDLIKMDCEGYELNVVRGALQTILNNKPVIIVEQKPGHGKTFGQADDGAVQYLRSIGMKQHSVISGDYVMVW